jgi:hypothetical protein
MGVKLFASFGEHAGAGKDSHYSNFACLSVHESQPYFDNF